MLKATHLLLPALLVLVLTNLSLNAQATTYEVQLSTIAFVNLELGDDCMRETIYQNFLSGDFDTDGDGQVPPQEAFIITIEDGMEDNGNVVDGCGTYRFTVVPNPDSTVIGFTFGQGQVTARDATPPRQIGPFGPLPGPFLTTDLADLTINSLPAGVPREYFTNGNTSAPIMTPANGPLLTRLMAAGPPVRFLDACSDVRVTVNDNIQVNGPCEDIIITRTFTATDASGDCAGDGFPQMETVISYDIVLQRPDVADVIAPAEVANFACDDPAAAAGELPNPEPSDYPFLTRADGSVIFLNEVFGNVGASFTNSAPVQVCDNTFKYVRTYTVIDWCDTDNVRTFTQLVKVGDTAPPTIDLPGQENGPLVLSTNAPGCGAILTTQLAGLTVTDGCSATTTLTALVLVGGDEESALGPINVNAPNPVDRLTPFLPAGDHVLRYLATDECGNESAIDVDIRIEDRSGPVMIVEDAINVSLSTSGFAVIDAEDLDRGSYDDCTGITLDIAFVSPNSLLAIGAFGPSITLSCIDVGSVPVIVRATDFNGNENTRMSVINVIDNSAPVCIAPGNMTISCTEASDLLPEDVNTALVNDEAGTTQLLDNLFGAPTSVDNCGNETVSQLVNSTINDCGVGVITRTFTVSDANGFASAPGCDQTVTIEGVRDYTITLPGDASAGCGFDPDFGDLEVAGFGCDMIVTHVAQDTFYAASDACFKVRRTLEVINWCEYDGNGAFYDIPRDADLDGNFNEDTYVHVIPGGTTNAGNDVAILDRDANRDNNNNITFVDGDDLAGGQFDNDNDGDTGYANSISRGAFRYVQFIKVFDAMAPTIASVTASVDPGQDCEGGAVNLSFSVTDNCTGANVDAQLALDLDHLPGGTFNVSRTLSTGEVARTGSVFRVNLTDIPTGQHAVRVTATDGCGNTDNRIITFDVTDETTVTPICAGRLTFVLIPNGTGGGIAMVEADDYVVSTNGNCNNDPLEFSVYRIEGETDQPGFVPQAGRVSFPVACEDVGEIPVRTYVFTPNGNFSFCDGTAVITAGFNVNCEPPNLASISGFVVSPQNELLRDIPVRITDPATMNDMMYTDANGAFLFTSLEMGGDYMVTPETEPEVNLHHVRTSDINTIGRHALGTNIITDPYRMIAGDVNGDGFLDVRDMLAIRRVILELDPTYTEGPTWRYIRRDFDLEGLTEGWDPSVFPDYYSIEELDGHNRDSDFIGIEIGNVFRTVSGRDAEDLFAEDRVLRAGERYDLTLTAGDLTGFQGALSATTGLAIEGWSSDLLTAGHVNDANLGRGVISFSYDGVAPLATAPVLTLHLRAAAQLRLSDYLRLDDRVTYAEALLADGQATDLSLTFREPTGGADLVLHQNFPNPVAAQTTIVFELPAAATAILTVRDPQGRLLTERPVDATAGRNTITLSTDDLKYTTGILTYTLAVGQRRLTKRMTVVAR